MGGYINSKYLNCNSTGCITYNGSELTNLSVSKGENLTSILTKIDSLIGSGGGGGVSSVSGTSNRISVTGTTTPVIDIAAAYVGQTSLTTLGTIATGTWQGSSISTTYTDAKVKTVTGTSNRLTIGGTATDPTFDISTGYVGQATITTLGTIATGVWNGTAIVGQYGGTGVNNSGKTITLGGNLTTSGAFATTLTSTNTTNVTLPTTGTLATLAGSETLTNKTISGATNTIDNLNATNLASGTVPDARLQYVKSLLGGSYAATNTVAGSSTQYLTAYGGYSNFNTENVRSYICPVAGTIRTLYVVTSTTQPSNGSLILSFRKNGVTQALTLTIAANAVAGTFSDLTHSFTVAAGDTISIEGINAATTASAAVISVSAILTNF